MRKNAYRDIVEDSEIMASALLESILKSDYVTIRTIVKEMSKKRNEFHEIRVTSPNGFEIAGYKNNRVTEGETYSVNKEVMFEQKKLATIFLHGDYHSVDIMVDQLRNRLIFAGVAITLMLGSALWFLFRYMAIEPLEQTVNNRTQALLYANKKLQNEIEERNTIQQKLIASENRFKYLISKSPAIIYTCKPDDEMTVTFVSENAKSILGYEPQVFLSDNKFWSGRVHPEDTPRFMSELRDVLSKGGHSQEYRFLHSDGSYRWIRDDMILACAESGEPVEILGSCIDITEHKKIEEQLRQSQKMESIGTLAGGVAHDFNNTLTAIISYGTLAKRRIDNDETTLEYINEMLNGAKRAADLTQSLLAFSRKQIISPKLQNLNSIVANMEKMLRRIIGEDIKFRAVLDSRDINVKVDTAQIDQVLLNLVTNARDAMPDGGDLIIETNIVNNCSEVNLLKSSGICAVLSVSDTGRGIDQHAIDNIFEPFFTTKEVGKGTGLGLSIVYGIVKQHGGEIAVESKIGKGTTFKIYLPLVDAEGDEEESEADMQAPLGKGETILLADDDAGVRKVVNLHLTMSGYKVIEAENGEEAVSKYIGNFLENKEWVDLLLIDVIMPVKNGRDAYEEIKTINPDIKAIFMSGYTDDIISQKGIVQGGFNFMSKPPDHDELLRKIRTVLDRHDTACTALGA
ncbi:MAG: PAS domain-containing protein [Nitrospirae bacterium]|nr:PAS domain-containing protein [Nitrospirota bacterium]